MATEKRLIYLDELLKFPIRIDNYDKENGNEHFVYGIETVLEYAENLPTVDAVEVVRCKDCRFILDRVDGTHGCYRHFMGDCNYDDFCSYGERKDNG